ncbi:MAG TPA: DNA recombination protein RmuC [Mycobacteriales bacterium]|nr:DNA recombination protein RmuC [Mycobacteriales bacterium]
MEISGLVLAIVTAALGLLAGWALGRSGTAAAVAATGAERDTLRSELETTRGELTTAYADLAASRTEVAVTAERLEAEKSSSIQRLADLQRSEEQLKESFQALSAQVLEANSARFLEVAQETLKATQVGSQADLDQRRQAVEALVKPLREELAKIDTQVHALEVKREGAYQGLLEQISEVRQSSEKLRVETASLVTALRKPQARGRWGELQLRRTVELAGMVERCDFDEQVTGGSDDGAIRPDLVIHLPGGKHVVVDSKCALEGFLEAAEAADEAAHRAALQRHARHVKTHIDGLAKKSYGDKVADTPEFVVMFLPGEALLSAALDGAPDLLEYGAEKSVILATPTTLIALLRTVSFTWRQESLAESAREVAGLGRELYDRLSKMGGDVSKLGRGLESAVKAYNEAVGALEGRVLVTARKLAAHGLRDDEMAAPKQIEMTTRRLQAAELVESEAHSRPVVALTPGEVPFELDDELKRAAGLS